MNLVDTDLQSIQLKLRTRLHELEEQLAPLQTEASKVRTQLELVEKALRVNGEHATISQTTAGTATSVTGIVEKILSDAATPLHISEIRKRYIAKGNQIPGQGAESNLLVYMVRDARFVRVAKGTYGLASSGLPPAPARRRRRRRTRKSGGK